MSWYGGYERWKPYVPAATRRAKAASYAAALAKKEKRTLAPVRIEGRKIAKSFWGLAWCENLERYSDFANRLPRGGTYARNGSVIDLQIGQGTITALVSGSEIYTITIKIETLPSAAWTKIKEDCSQSIESLLDLIQGKFDRGIMERLTQTDGGLFPKPKEIKLSCSCPDAVGMCKHIAAAMYGVGHRLDSSPELLFRLRAVDHIELIGQAVSAENLDRSLTSDQENTLAGRDLGELFGIELDVSPADVVVPPVKKNAVPKTRAKKSIRAGNAISSSAVESVNLKAGIKNQGIDANRVAKGRNTAPEKGARKVSKPKRPAKSSSDPEVTSRLTRKSVVPVATETATVKRARKTARQATPAAVSSPVARKSSRARNAK